MVHGIKAIRPQHDFVLVRRCEPVKVTPGGVIPYTTEEQKHAIVLEVGPGRPDVPATVPLCKRGDMVLLDRFIGVKLNIDGKDCNMVKWGDIQAIVDLTEAGKELFKDELLDSGSQDSCQLPLAPTEDPGRI